MINKNFVKLARIVISVLAISLIHINITGCSKYHEPGETGKPFNADRRNVATRLNDELINTKANLALSRQKDLWQQSHITVTCYDNVVLLLGQTPTPEFKALAQDVILALPESRHIQHVYNNITIQQPASFKARALDTWITGQVKALILANVELGSSRVKVVTEGKVVYLMGILTAAEQELAASLARGVKAVEQVVMIAQEPKI